jgi:hypothetical protein
MNHTPTWKRVWPTLLSASAQAAVRASQQMYNRSADIHAAIILSRAAFDAYLHELIKLRRLPRYVCFATGQGARKFLSNTQWRLIGDARHTLVALSKQNARHYEDVRELPLSEKLKALLLLLTGIDGSPLITNFEQQFKPILQLNILRNAIVHHEFGPPTQALVAISAAISSSLGIPPPSPKQPWEDLLNHAPVAVWACKQVCGALLAFESIEHNRPIHLSATRDSVASAISPLTL